MVEWGWYAEAYKAIHDKIAEVLAKLDAPSDPQTAQLLDNLGNVLFDNPARYLPVRLTDGTSFYAAGGGAGGGLVQCQIRNEAGTDWINEPYARDVLDRADRLLGRVYGGQGQQLLQRATTYDLIVQLRHAGAEIDPRQIRALTSSDVVDVSDRAARDLGHLDVDNFPSDYPLPSTQVSDLKNVTLVSSLPAGANNIGDVDVVSTAGLKASELNLDAEKDLHIDVKTLPNVVQAAKDRSIQREGTPSRINVTTSGQIIAAPGAGNKLVLCGFVVSVDVDEIVRLRWNGATGPIIATLPTKGIIGMNLIGVNEASGENQNLYLEKTGSGNAQGTVWTKTVSV